MHVLYPPTTTSGTQLVQCSVFAGYSFQIFIQQTKRVVGLLLATVDKVLSLDKSRLVVRVHGSFWELLCWGTGALLHFHQLYSTFDCSGHVLAWAALKGSMCRHCR